MSQKKLSLLVPLLLALLVALCYWRVAVHEFVDLDDGAYILYNDKLGDNFSWQGLHWTFQANNGNWHPLTWWSLMVDYRLYGHRPAGYLLTNVAIHIVNSVLLFLLMCALARFLGAKGVDRYFWVSAFVAALFAVHPLRVESVAWATERKDVLAGLWWILTTLAYLRYTRSPGIANYALLFCSFILGLMAKSTLVTLPFVLLLLDYWPLHRFSAKDLREKQWYLARLIAEKIPLLSCSAIVSYIAASSVQPVPLDRLPVAARFGNALVAYIVYLGKFVWPQNLAVIYPHLGANLPLWKIIAASVLLLAITIFAWQKRRQSPWFLVGWLWFLGVMVPMLGLVQVGVQAMADRFTYIPMIGLNIILAWSLLALLEKYPKARKAAITMCCSILFALTLLSKAQVHHWRHTLSLFSHAVQVTEKNFEAHVRLGTTWAQYGENELATQHYQQALQISPNYADAHNGLGLVMFREGKTEQAIDHFSKAIEEYQGFADAHNNMGMALATEKKLAQAIDHFTTAISLRSNYPIARRNLGLAYREQKKYQKAIATYKELLAMHPTFIYANYQLGLCYQKLRQYQKATEHYRREIRYHPKRATAARYQLGIVSLVSGDIATAKRLRKEIWRFSPRKSRELQEYIEMYEKK